jgi:hypothetical protein
MVHCPRCGQLNPVEHARCDDCGYPLTMDAAPPQPASRRQWVSRWTLVGIVVAFAAANVAYRLLHVGRLEQTAALFIGLPSFLAILLALSVRPRSPMGIIMAGITFALLLSGPLLGEGFICIVMAAPLFYFVGWVVGLIVEVIRDRWRQHRPDDPSPPTAIYGLALLPLLLLSLEGVHPALSFPREETITVRRVLNLAPDQVEAALASPPRFDRELPFYLGLGFPRPTQGEGAGLDVGDRRSVRFGRGARELTLEVVDRGPNQVRFRAVSDSTRIAQWLGWQDAAVEWHEVGAGITEVRWTQSYQRRLDPAWYFAPWERYAVGLAAEYLIETVANRE